MQNDFENEFFKQLVYDTVDFIQTPPPKDITIRCKITVIKGIFNEYLFYIEDANMLNGSAVIYIVWRSLFRFVCNALEIGRCDRWQPLA